jgi:hypothetical protein
MKLKFDLAVMGWLAVRKISEAPNAVLTSVLTKVIDSAKIRI